MKRAEVLAELNRAMTASDEELRGMVAGVVEERKPDGSISKIQLLAIAVHEAPIRGFHALEEKAI